MFDMITRQAEETLLWALLKQTKKKKNQAAACSTARGRKWGGRGEGSGLPERMLTPTGQTRPEEGPSWEEGSENGDCLEGIVHAFKPGQSGMSNARGWLPEAPSHLTGFWGGEAGHPAGVEPKEHLGTAKNSPTLRVLRGSRSGPGEIWYWLPGVRGQ